MKLPTQILAERPRVSLAIAAALFPAIFALRLIAPETGDAVTFLYVVPVVLVAVAYGGSWGLAAAAVAFSLSTVWVLIESIPVSALGYAVRALAFGTVGFLVGRFSTQLRRLEAESARHFALSLDMICIAGLNGYFKAVNPAFERTLGYSQEELLGRPFVDFIHPDDRERTESEAAAIPDGDGTVHFQNRWFDKQGELHWLEWSSAMFADEGLIYAVARDVTDRKELEQELERLSQHDPLTGVYNRRRFDEELSAGLDDARRHERGGALLLIDLDRFKKINDELGHAAGDFALCEVARVLAENTRGSDAVGRDADGIVARVGGDEFAVLLAEVGPVEAAAIGERLVAVLDATDLRVEGNPVPLAISVGVAPFNGRQDVDAKELLALADQAMYVVKAGGGGGAREASPAGRGFDAEPA
jgi:diguanylate cyclase (GGDEF)-like protein/PAS domain S-box-containing protein